MNHDCVNCRYYPCHDTERIHAFMKEMEFDVTITLNGCYKFIAYDKLGSNTEHMVLGHDINEEMENNE